MQDLIQTITEEVSVKDHTFCLSVLRFNGVDETMDEVQGQAIVGAAYMQLVQELNENPNAQAQMSACLITDMSPIGDFLTKEALDEWYDNATADSVQTQRALYETFQRPVFTIIINNTRCVGIWIEHTSPFLNVSFINTW
ncbi:MAG: hypothetical protein AAFV93_15815 [Chloroflexota bacterium]